MSIFDIFTQQQQPAQQQPAPETSTPAQPGNLPSETPPTVEKPAAQEPKQPSNPLDSFKDLWNTDATKKGNEQETFNLDPSKLNEVVNKADFSSTIPQETFAAIAQGGEDATKAFADAMNTIARQVFSQSLIASNRLTENRLQSANKNQQQIVADMVRNQLNTNTLADTDPLFSNPAVKPIMEAVQTQLSSQNPTSTPQQIAAQTQDFIKAIVEAASPKQQTDNTPVTEDWSKFLT